MAGRRAGHGRVGYWLCRPWCDCLGREAMKLSKG